MKDYRKLPTISLLTELHLVRHSKEFYKECGDNEMVVRRSKELKQIEKELNRREELKEQQGIYFD